MTDETMPPSLWQETQRATESWEQARGLRESGPGLAAQVLTLPELGEPRLAWAVLHREARENGRLLLVAADSNPLVGSGDVAVAGLGAGSLTLRCRFAVWVSERELGATPLLGTLAPESLSRAEARWQALEAGHRVGTFSEQETEEDPEYHDWIEDVVRPAAGSLEARAGTTAPSLSPALPFPTPSSKEHPPSPRGAWMRWAAVLAFVVLGAGSGFFGWKQMQEIAGLRAAVKESEATHRQAVAELEDRRADLESQYQAQLQTAGEDRARLESEHLARLEELEEKLAKLRQATEVKNPLIAGFDVGAQRGTKRLEVGPEVSHLVLMLPVDNPAANMEFQIEIYEKHSNRRVLVQTGLRVDIVFGEVRLGLPAVLLPPGDYRLRLFRKEGEKLLPVREYLIEIDKGPTG